MLNSPLSLTLLFGRKEGTKHGALILVNFSHFNRTPLYVKQLRLLLYYCLYHKYVNLLKITKSDSLSNLYFVQSTQTYGFRNSIIYTLFMNN